MMRLMFINTKRTHKFSVKLDDDNSYDDDDKGNDDDIDDMDVDYVDDCDNNNHRKNDYLESLLWFKKLHFFCNILICDEVKIHIAWCVLPPTLR